MLRSISDLRGCKIQAADGYAGSVEDILFDDASWIVRYLIVDTGNWLPGRKVLISPFSIDTHRQINGLSALITRQQIEDSPNIDTDKPVSRQHEADYLSYYGIPYYWSLPAPWGASGHPDRTTSAAGSPTTSAAKPIEQRDPHLRSSTEVIGYYIEATDGEMGHVEDFLIDNKDWTIRYIVVDTVNWWLGKKVLVAPDWLERVSWEESKVYVNLAREKIKSAPDYDASLLISRKYEDELYDHYDRRKYWKANR
ncbi:MAG TPA: PRC-barrel domain-containing protein [Pyrinomonadaceae bacterium]